MVLQTAKKLANGIDMPIFGLGVYKMTDPQETIEAITKALEVGYRAIDTASLYHNEEQVGEAIRYSGVPREEIFVTTKVWNTDQGFDNTLRAFEVSLKKLDMDYVDLYLTHWPVEGKYTETYRAIERLYDEKLIRVPGVSNHHQRHLEEVLKVAQTPPMVNQIEAHPYLSQEPLRAFCQEHNIAVTAWSPLGRGAVLKDETIVKMGDKYGKTPAQIVLRWHIQNDILVIPKSVTPSRIEENADIFHFELAKEDMQLLNGLNKNQRFGKDPENFHFYF